MNQAIFIDFQQFQERVFENHVSYVSIALCNGTHVHLNTGQYCSSVKNGLSSTRDQVRFFKTVSEEQDYLFFAKKKSAFVQHDRVSF